MEKKNNSIETLTAHFNKALKHQSNGEYKEAENFYNAILNIIPTHVDSLHYLGLVKYAQGGIDDAVSLINQALRQTPNEIEIILNLAVILQESKRLDEACDLNLRVLSIDSNHAMAHHFLGQIYKELGNEKIADMYCRKAYHFDHDNVAILNEYANYLLRHSKFFEALKILEKGYSYNPSNYVVLSNLISVLFSIGDFKKAYCLLTELYHMRTDDVKTIKQQIFYTNYRDDLSVYQVFKIHVDGADILTHFQSKDNGGVQRSEINFIKDRKIKIAYMSSDFHFHSVSFFIKPILQNHDNTKFEVFCYSNKTREDNTTRDIKKLCHHWRDIKQMCDREVIQLIRDDDIDILVDLSGYSAGNRLGVFVRRAAPMQMTYLGYPNTTGLSSIDYRMTDEYTDPVGMTEHLNTETLVRLEHGFLCYSPSQDCPQIAPPPVVKNGYITFGSFNNMAKINDKVISLWSKVLAACPNSRILLKSKSLADNDVKKYLLSRFDKFNISEDRILMKKFTNGYPSHMATYNEVDISLDTFPYNGTTTTCESLWMGVPVVTLLGGGHISRVSGSILNAVGLNGLIADDENEFVKVARNLACNEQTLSKFRSTIREKMKSSGFTDGKKFTKELEQKYMTLWRGMINEM